MTIGSAIILGISFIIGCAGSLAGLIIVAVIAADKKSQRQDKRPIKITVPEDEVEKRKFEVKGFYQ